MRLWHKRLVHVLLTNDDGIFAPGIRALYNQLKPVAEVSVVAPDAERSAVGHAITLSDPLRVSEYRFEDGQRGFAVSGTPADCVKIAVCALLEHKPDLVISGINLGPNVGISILYSGTVSGATEGAILGIPSMAVSLGTFSNPDFSVAAGFASDLAFCVARNGLPAGTLLNVNVPPLPREKIKGVAVTSQGRSRFIETFDRRQDPRGHTYYWMDGYIELLEAGLTVDTHALDQGYISVTPLSFNLTSQAFLEPLRAWALPALRASSGPAPEGGSAGVQPP